LDEKISCLPLVNSDENITGALTKVDIMNMIAVKGEAFIEEIMDAPVNVRSLRFSNSNHFF
jgi:predicted transcriptional regulator